MCPSGEDIFVRADRDHPAAATKKHQQRAASVESKTKTTTQTQSYGALRPPPSTSPYHTSHPGPLSGTSPNVARPRHASHSFSSAFKFSGTEPETLYLFFEILGLGLGLEKGKGREGSLFV